MSTSQSPLAASLASLTASTSLLSSTLAILGDGTQDLDRIRTVLSQTRHFELLPSYSLTSAQTAVVDELVPEIELLLNKAEHAVERRERREEWLRARWALGEGRLGREADLGPGPTMLKDTATLETNNNTQKHSGVDNAKAQRLRQKKERLSYAVERLTLQASQRERQLRKSMAAQEQRDAA
ncbi:MAG: hypothetical protein M1828_001705 [Chrysothrix sp. TS-e1954]|nr:MAG: hypothetical protein M1828_001705 [Chrysothrix sp. TS-e1954]